jgi:hypothetical protein
LFCFIIISWVKANWVERLLMIGGYLLSISLISLFSLRKNSWKIYIPFGIMGIISVGILIVGLCVQINFDENKAICQTTVIPNCLIIDLPDDKGNAKPVKVCATQNSATIPIKLAQIANLVSLSGQPALDDKVKNCLCSWEGRLNNVTFAPINSSTGDCTFSIPLQDGTKNIDLRLEINSTTKFLKEWGLKAESRFIPFLIQIEK